MSSVENLKQASTTESKRLGKNEFFAMNNPIRRFIQRTIEMKVFCGFLKKNNINLKQKVLLDVGCGSAYSTKLLIRRFKPSEIVAFDIMPEQINLAKKRQLKARLYVGDALNIDMESGSCDAVFIFGVLHHIPKWKEVMLEINRVLKEGGVLLVEEPKIRFEWNQFDTGLKESGYETLEKRKFLHDNFRSYLCKKK
jgi:ubiquinone/menaquinone biosynthesis C-methylase UbiE